MTASTLLTQDKSQPLSMLHFSAVDIVILLGDLCHQSLHLL